jgi:hypothetical protein
MAAVSPCPDGGKLEQLQRDQLPLAEVEQLAQHLEQCERCAASLRELPVGDTLSEALRARETLVAPAEQPLVHRLMAALKKLPAPPAAPWPERSTEVPRPPSVSGAGGGFSSGPDSTQEDYAFLAPAESPGELGRLGSYRVLRRLGSGGMGIVFEAEDPQLRRQVALKVMRPALAAGVSARQRFLREARAMAALKHDHVITIYQVGEDQGVPFLAMELLEGESLADRLQREPVPPLAEVRRIGREMAEALAAAHERGLIHRDIKPANVWLEGERRRVKILDFGLALSADDSEQLTASGVFLGTPAYMAPEQGCGDPVDGRCDLFSLGCVLYQMTTGRLPFPGKNALGIRRAVVSEEPPAPQQVRPAIPQALSDLIVRLLAKKPEGRPASARAVAEVLAALEGVKLGDSPRELRPGRSRLAWWIGLAAVVLLIGVAVAAWYFTRPRDGTSTGDETRLVPLKGWIDVRLWRPELGRGRDLGLHDQEALPLTPDSEVSVEAQLNHPGYLYVIWIDSKGEASPIFPWKPGQWEARPTGEEPMARLRRPAQERVYWPLKKQQPGMETLLLLARQTPWPADVDLEKLLTGLPEQKMQNAAAAVWFENWQVVKEDEKRSPVFFDERRRDDPVLETQRLLQERLGKYCDYSRAVSFANKGG